ncbi:MAG: spermine/spermidine synthase domain-containing protein [Lysobacteraceae bacterium]
MAAFGRGRDGHPRPFVKRGLRYTSLQFDRLDAQSRMLTFDPDRLLIDYTRTMMGALLFQPRPRRIGMIGLGGGSQAKFIHRHLPSTRLEVVEINPHVLRLRRRFRVPRDDARLSVQLGDGAEWIHRQAGRFDILLVDAYDPSGIPEAVSTARFYAGCRAALAADGVIATNLYTSDAGRHLRRLGHAFGGRVAVVEESGMSNRVAFAWVGDPFQGGAVAVAERLAQLPRPAAAQLTAVFHAVAGVLPTTGSPGRR